MGLAIDSIRNQNPTPISRDLAISPASYNDDELSTLLSGSGSLKTTSVPQKEIGEVMTEKSDNKSALAQIGLNSLPSLASTLVFYGFSKNKITLVAGFTAMVASNLVSFLKDKSTAKA